MEGEAGSAMANIRAAMRSEWPLVEAALLPVLGLLLGVIGILGRDAAVNVAIGAGVIELFAWGIAAGRKLKLPTGRTIVVGVVDGASGLLMVALKVLVHQLTCSTPVTLSTPWSTSAGASPRPRMTSLPPKAQMTSVPDVPFQRIGHEVARRAEAREVTSSSSTSSRSSASTRAWPRRVRSSARGA
jgi:hypothetical protein